MVKRSVVSGIIAGFGYFLLTWLGDKFIFGNEQSMVSCLLQGVFFAIAMSAFYYLTEKQKKKKEKE